MLHPSPRQKNLLTGASGIMIEKQGNPLSSWFQALSLKRPSIKESNNVVMLSQSVCLRPQPVTFSSA